MSLTGLIFGVPVRVVTPAPAAPSRSGDRSKVDKKQPLALLAGGRQAWLIRGDGMVRNGSTGGYRPHALQRRDIAKTARFNEPEMSAVVSAAARAQLRVGAWIAKAAVEAALADNNPRRVAAKEIGQQLMQVQTELQQLRRASVLHGNNLNQLAAAANTTGEVGLASSRVIANIDRIVAQLDERLSAVDALLARIVDRFEST